MPFLRYQTSPSFLSPTVSWSSQYRYSLPPPPPPTSGSTGWACVWLNWMLSCDLIDKLFLYLLNLRDMDLYWWRNVVFVGKIWIVAKRWIWVLRKWRYDWCVTGYPIVRVIYEQRGAQLEFGVFEMLIRAITVILCHDYIRQSKYEFRYSFESVWRFSLSWKHFHRYMLTAWACCLVWWP